LVLATMLTAATPCAPLCSRVEIVVTLGPTCPVERAEGPPCSRPFTATIRIANTSGAPVASVRSGPDGRTSVCLPPGTYVFVGENPSGQPLPRGERKTVTVQARHAIEVKITFDTGIR
jgi:hypothetical protein